MLHRALQVQPARAGCAPTNKSRPLLQQHKKKQEKKNPAAPRGKNRRYYHTKSAAIYHTYCLYIRASLEKWETRKSKQKTSSLGCDPTPPTPYVSSPCAFSPHTRRHCSSTLPPMARMGPFGIHTNGPLLLFSPSSLCVFLFVCSDTHVRSNPRAVNEHDTRSFAAPTPSRGTYTDTFGLL